MADDELEAIQAIFCQPKEITIVHGNNGSKEVKVRLNPTADPENASIDSSFTAQLCLLLPPTYPSSPPEISLLSDDSLSRKETSHLRTLLHENANRNIDQPMLLDLITLANEELHKMLQNRKCEDKKDAEEGEGGREGVRLALLHLDHMRAKNSYVKLIKKWTGELGLSGALIFCQRLILIVLQGCGLAVKEYIVRQRSSNVDVDSRGQPCKERMLSVLCDIPVESHQRRLGEFHVEELGTGEEVRRLFTDWGLHDLCTEHVLPLKRFPAR